jgi:peptide deformylase
MNRELRLSEEDVQRFAEERALGMIGPESSVLNQKATRVLKRGLGTKELKSIIARLFAAAGGQIEAGQNGETKNMRRLVGLAAPQIGESKQIIIIDTRVSPDRKGESELECFINPKIVWHSKETAAGREGCFSAGPFWGLVRRPIAVRIKALTPEGKTVERTFEGFTARIAQHEIDHLKGIRFPERIRSDRHRHWVQSEELLEYAKQPERWTRTVSRAEWEAFKRGELPMAHKPVVY